MKQIIDKNQKVWSLIGLRGSFGLMCNELVKDDKNFYVLTADVSTSAGLDRFKKNYPERLIDVGIAEQNMVTIAAGMASEGNNIFTPEPFVGNSFECKNLAAVNFNS